MKGEINRKYRGVNSKLHSGGGRIGPCYVVDSVLAVRLKCTAIKGNY